MAEDKRAITDVRNFILFESLGWGALYFAMFWLLCCISAATGYGIWPISFLLIFVAAYPLLILGAGSSRTFTMLPMSRVDFNKAIWQLLNVFPAVILAVECSAVFISSLGFYPHPLTTLNRMATGLSPLILWTGGMPGMICVMKVFMPWAHEYSGLPARHLNKVEPIVWLAFLACLFLPIWNAQFSVLLTLLGGAGAIVSYRLREYLIGNRTGEGESEPSAPRQTATPQWRSLPHGLFSLLLSNLFSSCLGACFLLLILFPRTPDPNDPYSSFGYELAVFGSILGGAAMCSIWAYRDWQGPLRMWRMLPLSRTQLSAAFVGGSVLVGGATWLICLFVFEGFRNAWIQDNWIAVLGGSLLVQGLFLTLFPYTLRRWEDSDQTANLKILFAIGAFLILCLGGIAVADFYQHGRSLVNGHELAWLLAGCAALCVGIVFSMWKIPQILDYSDCYRKNRG